MRRVDRFVLFPLLCPAGLLAANNDAFGFDPPGWLDSYMYLGYFWHYPEHLWIFDDNSNYKISRLPWVLPGFAAHTLLSPVIAARVLAYCALASAAVALYLHVRDAIKDRYAAAFVSVLLACCVGMHAPGGWYYQALPAAGFYLWSCWLLTRAASATGRPLAWAAGAGACFAAAIHTHVFLAVFAPLLVLLFWGALERQEHQAARWRTAIIGVVVGGVGLTAVLAVINRVSGGAWLFFVPQLEIAFKLSGGDRWWLPMDQWLPNSTYLVLPIALTMMGLLTGHRPWKVGQRMTGTLVVLPWVALALTCVFQFQARVTTLDYDYMAFVLFLHAFPAAALALASPSDGSRRQAGLLACATTLVLASLLVFMPSQLPLAMAAFVERVGLAGSPRMVPPLLISLVGVVIARVVPREGRVIVVAIWFSIVNAWIAPQPQAYGLGTPGTRQEMLETFRDADVFTHGLDPSLMGIKYWMSSEDLTTPSGPLPSQPVFDSFVATRAWFTNLFARQSPPMPISTLTRQHLAVAPCVGILSSRERQGALTQEMMAHYALLDDPLVVVAERQFQRRDFGFSLTVLRPVSRIASAEADAPPCLPAPSERR